MRNLFSFSGWGDPFVSVEKLHFPLKKKNNAIFKDTRFLPTAVLFQLFFTKPHLFIFILSVLYCHAAVR